MSYARSGQSEDGTFEWKFTDPDTEETYESTFTLRRLPREESQRLKGKHTRKKWIDHQPDYELDRGAFTDDALDYCIVDWTGVRGLKSNEEQPCIRKHKLVLPVRVEPFLGKDP